MDYKELANVLFPNLKYDTQFYLDKYKSRNINREAKVVRFAPSPTGLMHFGGLFTSFLNYKIAKQTKGVNILRIEDTDTQRKIENGSELIIESLKGYKVSFDEYPGRGKYSPYIQSERGDIYKAFAKKLVHEGKAYPCFCTKETIESDRKQQEVNKEPKGYYGAYAHCRNLNADEIYKKIKNGEKFVIRLRIDNDTNPEKLKYKDAIRGKLVLTSNHQDVIILKSDPQLPPYNFAHIIDDYLMGVNLALRGDEFLASLSEHIQIYKALDIPLMQYAHIAPIQIMDGESKRKLSKRKDKEATVVYYQEEGYPYESVLEYIMTIANSNFENWRNQNSSSSIDDFDFNINKMSRSGALFDIDKLNSVSKNVISRMTGTQIYEKCLSWSEEYNKKLYKVLAKDKKYSIKVFSVERGKKKPRKDIAKWSDVEEYNSFFFNELFDVENSFTTLESSNYSKEDIISVLEQFKKTYNSSDDRGEWFNKIKEIAKNIGFATDMQEYKSDPQNFKGHYGDVSLIIRMALTGSKQSPDLYEVCSTLGTDRIFFRLNKYIEFKMKY